VLEQLCSVVVSVPIDAGSLCIPIIPVQRRRGVVLVGAATRFEALEPIRQGVQCHFGGFAATVAPRLKLRQVVRAPEGNGRVERFIRTLKENLLPVRIFETIEQLRQALLAFRERRTTKNG
jgi:hypothetical protein